LIRLNKGRRSWRHGAASAYSPEIATRRRVVDERTFLLLLDDAT
jgi:hypothetical protein